MSDNVQAIPKSLNLGLQKPTSIPAYTRRVTSLATNAQTFKENDLANSSDSSIHIILTSEIEGYVLSQKNIENINANSAGYTSRDSVFFKGFNEDKVLPKKSVGKYIFGSILMFVGSIIIPVAIITGTSQEDNGVYDNQFRTGLSSRNVTGIAIATVGIGFAACGVLMISTDKK